MTTWAELLKGRKAAPSMRHSAHMLECRRLVLAKYPNAHIIGAGHNLWKLRDGEGPDLSNPHNSEYACWAEGRKVMESMP